MLACLGRGSGEDWTAKQKWGVNEEDHSRRVGVCPKISVPSPVGAQRVFVFIHRVSREGARAEFLACPPEQSVWREKGRRRESKMPCFAIKQHHAALAPPAPHTPHPIILMVSSRAHALRVACSQPGWSKPTPLKITSPLPAFLPLLVLRRRRLHWWWPGGSERRLLRRRKGHAGMHEALDKRAGRTGWCGCLDACDVDAYCWSAGLLGGGVDG